MNILRNGLSLFTSTAASLLRSNVPISPAIRAVPNSTTPILSAFRCGFDTFSRLGSSLGKIHRKGYHVKNRPNKSPLKGKPFAKGIVLKTLIKKPKKPNSANRKCVLLRLSIGKEMVAHVPGIGHNLQEHNIVLVKVGRLQDVPGVKLTCVRGMYDLPHVIKQEPKK